MKARISLLLVTVSLLGSAACTATSTTSTTATSGPAVTAQSGTTATTDAPKNEGTTKKSTSGTAKKAPTKSPITKPSTVETVEKSKLPSKSQEAETFTGLTQDESDCVYTVIYKTVLDDPTIEGNEPKLAGVTGGALVACVDADKLAKVVVGKIEQLPGATNLDSIDLACLEGALSAGGTEEGYFIGALIYEDPAIIADAAIFYEDICGVSFT